MSKGGKMPVSAIQNVSFASKKAKAAEENTEKKSDKYFKWISQNQVNDTLKLSVGREVEDGKYKAASGAAVLGAFVAGMTSWFKTLKVMDLAFDAKMLAGEAVVDAAKVGNIGKQMAKNKNIAKGAFFVTLGLLAISTFIENANKAKANATARQRGFSTIQDMASMKKNEEVYEKTDAIYNNFIKS